MTDLLNPTESTTFAKETRIPPTGTSIALIGRPDSGKTSLLSAFINDLTWYSSNDRETEYAVTDLLGKPVSQLSGDTFFQNIQAGRHVSETVTFHRFPKKSGYQVELNTFGHQIADLSGLHLEEVVTQSNFLDAAGLIVTLDPTQEVDHLQDLQTVFSAIGGDKRPVSICVTKADTHKNGIEFMRHQDPMQSLRKIFGDPIADFLQVQGNNRNVNVVVTSAVGYQGRIREHRSNFDEKTGQILYPEIWSPYNVAAPFFGALEANERRYFSQRKVSTGVSGTMWHIRYPTIRP